MESFALEAEEVLKHFGTDMYSGLSDDNVKENLKKYGVNGKIIDKMYGSMKLISHLELPKAEKTPLWKLIAEQFTDQLVQILLVAALISFVMVWVDGAAGEGIAAFVEPLVILLILVANAVVGVVQESNAEKAIEVKRISKEDTFLKHFYRHCSHMHRTWQKYSGTEKFKELLLVTLYPET